MEASFQHLPPETVAEIAQYASWRDVFSLSCASKRIRSILRPLIFSTVHIVSWAETESPFRDYGPCYDKIASSPSCTFRINEALELMKQNSDFGRLFRTVHIDLRYPEVLSIGKVMSLLEYFSGVRTLSIAMDIWADKLVNDLVNKYQSTITIRLIMRSLCPTEFVEQKRAGFFKHLQEIVIWNTDAHRFFLQYRGLVPGLEKLAITGEERLPVDAGLLREFIQSTSLLRSIDLHNIELSDSNFSWVPAHLERLVLDTTPQDNQVDGQMVRNHLSHVRALEVSPHVARTIIAPDVQRLRIYIRSPSGRELEIKSLERLLRESSSLKSLEFVSVTLSKTILNCLNHFDCPSVNFLSIVEKSEGSIRLVAPVDLSAQIDGGHCMFPNLRAVYVEVDYEHFASYCEEVMKYLHQLSLLCPPELDKFYLVLRRYHPSPFGPTQAPYLLRTDWNDIANFKGWLHPSPKVYNQTLCYTVDLAIRYHPALPH